MNKNKPQKTNKKDWVAKLHDKKDLPRVEKIPEKMTQKWGRGTIVIPAPIEVDEVMRQVPKGKLITMTEIREVLAQKHNATIGCPLTCGIFANIAARAAEQEHSEGKKTITPYWRTLKSDGSLNPKYPGGELNQKKLLVAEGHKVIKKGKKYLVENYKIKK